jgi:regulator of sigma E protease
LDPIPNSQPASLTPNSAASSTLSRWFKQHATRLIITIALVAAICWYLNPLDVLLVTIGLGGIIFLHELGHFLAAKACNVYVRTFSIGFGPPWPFCEFQYGETNYKLGMIPLGGYVAMAGETSGEMDREEAAHAHEDENNPRSFKNKPVWQRMIIISAGVIMNVILAVVCFILAYMNGVREMPPVLQGIEPGSAAWQAGIKPGSVLTKLNAIDHPWFADITPEVFSTKKGELVHIEFTHRGTASQVKAEPLRMEGSLYPQLGLSFPQSVQLGYSKRDSAPPFEVDSPAHGWNVKAATQGLPLILPGDTIVGMTDPANPSHVTPLEQNWNDLPGFQFDYRRRLAALVGKPITLELKRNQSTETVRVELLPMYRQDTGLRMKMGKIAAVRVNSPATNAGLKPQAMEGENEVGPPGDRIVEVSVPEADGKRTVYTTDPKKVADGAKLLDPLRLPFELNRWADRTSVADRFVTLTVLRDQDHTEKPVTLPPMPWDDSYREEAIEISKTGTPVSIGPLGLAYRVTTEVNAIVPNSQAALVGMQPGDVVKEVRYTARAFKKDKAAHALGMDRATDGYMPSQNQGNWEKVLPHQWAYADQKLQWQAPHQFDLKIDRGGQSVEVTLSAIVDTTWPVPIGGMQFQREFQTQTAQGVAEALQLGARRTVRAIKMTYQSLYGMVFGRISPLTMSGPITLARTGYIVAGEDVWVLILYVALISINLAVVNFLPIPVLDGGHMVFLLYEAIRGKAPPMMIQNWLTIAGLVCVLCLMLFTVGLDIWRLVF